MTTFTVKKGVLNKNAPLRYRGKHVTYEDEFLTSIRIHSLCGTTELIVKETPSVGLYLTKEYLFRLPESPDKCYPIVPVNWVDPLE